MYDPTCLTEFCRPLYSVLTIPDVTLADLASFRPAIPSLTGEPPGFGVVGCRRTSWPRHPSSALPGTLLGWDVLVRFVPADYVFEYGDGVDRPPTTGGASWQQLGQAQFTPTATSHVYRERGTYPVRVTVEYAASVDFGSGIWRPVDRLCHRDERRVRRPGRRGPHSPRRQDLRRGPARAGLLSATRPGVVRTQRRADHVEPQCRS